MREGPAALALHYAALVKVRLVLPRLLVPAGLSDYPSLPRSLAPARPPTRPPTRRSSLENEGCNMLLTSRSEPWARAPAPSGPACLSRADFEMPENGGTSVGVLSGMNELRRSMISSTCSRLRCCKMLYCTRLYCSSMIYSACRPPARLGVERNLLRGLTCVGHAPRTHLSHAQTHTFIGTRTYCTDVHETHR